MGSAVVTTQNLKVVRTDADRGLIMSRRVPCPKSGSTIKDALKRLPETFRPKRLKSAIAAPPNELRP